jgi:hypothetical protein
MIREPAPQRFYRLFWYASSSVESIGPGRAAFQGISSVANL